MSNTSASSVSVPASKLLLLRLSRAAFSMASLLGLRRLQEYMQGCTSLNDDAVWLLGTWYGLYDTDSSTSKLTSEAREALLHDFHSRIWCTYRKDFEALGAVTSDMGWGCTIRSGQMLLAEAVSRMRLGRLWLHTAGQPVDDKLLQVLSWFLDSSDEKQHPFSVHNFCSAGAPHGVVIGQWLGPWVLCKTLETLINRSAHVGICVHVVCDPGGGAPCVHVDRLQQLMQETSPAAKACDAADPSAEGAGQPEPSGRTLEEAAAATRPHGLLILVPLTLGVGQINPRYLPQLQQILTYPQSVGIVGGRPGSSLYFVGHQGDHFLYLDPHEAQPVASLPADVESYFCSTLRLTPLATIDPSLAIGFLCQTPGELEDLVERLQQLALESAGAPLMTVGLSSQHDAHGVGRPDAADDVASVASHTASDAGGAGGAGGEDWEML